MKKRDVRTKTNFIRIFVTSLAVYLVLSVFFVSCALAYQLCGNIYNRDGTPISGVDLSVVSAQSGAIIGTSTSNIIGAYSISVDQGVYSITVTPPPTSNYDSTTVEGISITGNLIQNIFLVPKGITLSGCVFNRGTPAKDVFVKIVNPCESIWVSLESTVGWSKTDINGNYSIIVPAGTYDIIVRAYSGSYTCGKLNPQYAYYRATEDLKIEGALNYDIDLPVFYLSGTVTGSNGEPVSDVQIGNDCTYSYKYRGSKFSYNYAVYAGYAKTGTDGRFDYPVFSAAYNFIVTPPSGSPYTKQFINGITINKDATRDIKLSNAPVLSGRVLDRNNAGVRDAFVKVVKPCDSIWVSLDSTVGWNKTDCNGNYSIVIPPGTYDIIVRAYSGCYIYNKLSPQYAYYRVVEDIIITESTNRNINLPIFYLTGTVTNSNGAPVSGVQVGNDCTYSYKYRAGTYCYNYAVYNGYAISGSDGKYNFPVFAASYNIIATPPSGSLYTKQFINGLCIAQDTVKDITLANAPILSGRVLDRNNAGMRDVFVKVVNPCDSIWTSLEGTVGWNKTDCNGNYSIVVPPGTYDIIIRAYSGTYSYNKLNPQYAYYRIAENFKIESDLKHDISLPIFYLTGIVVNSSGEPVSGVTIGNDCTYFYKYINCTYSYTYAIYSGYATTGTDGRFSFPVFSATYNFVVTPPANTEYAKFRIDSLAMTQDISKIIILESQNTAPIAEASAAPGSGLVPLVVNLTGKGIDADGTIVKYEWDFDGDGTYDWSSATSGNTSYTYADPGTFTAKLRVTDNDNLTGTCTLTIASIKDTTPPSIAITSPKDGYITNTGSVGISGTVSDNIAIAGVTVNNKFAQVSGDKFTASEIILNEDTNTITAQATDTSGNTKSASIIVTKDTTLPNISIDTPSDSYITNSADINVAGTVSDNTGIAKVTVNGKTALLNANKFAAEGIILNEGKNTITAEATDIAGNTKSISITVTKDTMPPVIGITSPADGYKTTMNSVNVNGTVSDASGISKVTINNAPAELNGNNFKLDGIVLNEGENIILTTATDIAGNSGSTTIKIIKDTTAPIIKITSPADGSTTNNANILVTGNVDDSEATVKLNGTEVAVMDNTFSKEITLSIGENIIAADAADKLGNKSSTSIMVKYVTAPKIEISPTDLPMVTLGKDEEETRNITIVNEGTEDLTFDIKLSDGKSTSTPWLAIDPSNGTLSPGESMVIAVKYKGSVDADEYSECIYINSNDEDNTPIAIGIKFIVQDESSLKWYLAEGCTDGFDTWILIMNCDSIPSECRVTFMKSDGSTVIKNITIPAASRYSIHANDYAKKCSVSTMVESLNGTKIVAERSMYWNPGNIPWGGGHNSMGVTHTSNKWYLAEGCTSDKFDTWVLVMNPNNTAAECKATFMKKNGSTTVTNITVPATGRYTISVKNYVQDDAVSTMVESTNNIPVIAERSVYWNSGGVHWAGGHCSVGVTSPEAIWYLAEGCTDGFDTWILIMNPNNTDAECLVKFLKTDGTITECSVLVPATGRYSINAKNYVPKESFSTKIEAKNGLGIIVERAMYWDSKEVPWGGGHCNNGVAYTANTWYLAEGCTSGKFSTWIPIMNPNNVSAECKLTFMCTDSGIITKNIVVPPTSRYTVNLNQCVPNDSVSTKVESLNGVGIMVERAMYWGNEEKDEWLDGHCSTGWGE